MRKLCIATGYFFLVFQVFRGLTPFLLSPKAQPETPGQPVTYHRAESGSEIEEGPKAIHLACPKNQDWCHLSARVALDGSAAEPFADLMGWNGDMAADKTHVCWAQGLVGWLVYCVGRDAPGQTVQAGTALGESALAVKGDYIFVAAAKEIVRLPKDGKAKEKKLVDQEDVFSLAVSGEHVYYFAQQTYPKADLVRVAVTGGRAETVVKDLEHPEVLAADGPFVFWSTFGHNQNGVVSVLDTKNGQVTALAEKQNQVRALAVDEDHVYWQSTAESGYLIQRVAREGGATQELALVESETWVRNQKFGFQAEGEYVYFSTQDKAMRVKKSGGVPQTLVTLEGDGDMISLAATKTHLYVFAYIHCSKGKDQCPQPETFP